MQENITDSTFEIAPTQDPEINSGNAVQNHLGIPTALGLWIFSILLILILPNLFVLPYVISSGMSNAPRDEIVNFLRTDPKAVLLQVVSVIPAHLLSLLAVWLVIKIIQGKPFLSTLGFRRSNVRWWFYPAFLAGFFLLAALVGNLLPEQENDLLKILRSSREAAYLVAILAITTAPLVEEIIYRGVLFSAIRSRFSASATIAAVTLIFAAIHFPQYYPSFSTILLVTILSFALTVLRERSGSLLPCYILHFLFNLFQSISLLLFRDDLLK